MDASSVILVLSCLGIAQALFLCAYLFTLKKGNRKAHWFLGLLILGLTVRIGKSILNTYIDLEAWERNLGIAGMLMVGAALWQYGKAVFHITENSKWRPFYHFSPYLLFSLLSDLIPNRFDLVSMLVYYAVFAHLLVYLIGSIRLWHRTKPTAQTTVSNWYRNLIIGVAVIWGFYIGNVSGFIPFYIGGAICYTFLVYVFSFLLLRKHSFQLEKYQGRKMDRSIADALLRKLDELIKTDAVYLNQKVSLAEVARSIDTAPKTLSRVINEQTGQNFSDFLNTYRIETAKNRLVDPAYRNDKIASIAYDSGFNNVTSFNTAFKEHTKMTPSAYRQKFG